MSGTLALVSIGVSLLNGASVNAMNGIDYSIFTILETMNLTPLINVFSQSIGLILPKTVLDTVLDKKELFIMGTRTNFVLVPIITNSF